VSGASEITPVRGIGPTPGPGSAVTTATVPSSTTARPAAAVQPALAEPRHPTARCPSTTISGTNHTQWCDQANGAAAAEHSPTRLSPSSTAPRRWARTASARVPTTSTDAPAR
jgi:hypothetical protein